MPTRHRPVMFAPVRSNRLRRGFTLIEVLMATALTALLMVGVVEMFAAVGDSVNDSRSILELSGRLRTVQTRLQMDLEGITVTMLPPRRPESNEGYAEFREGPIGPAESRLEFAWRPDPANPGGPTITDLTVTDNDDILMFTTRSKGRPFVGRIGGSGVGESDVAEVAWFVRGTTLYRRVLLVAPKLQPMPVPQQSGFYRDNDLSVRLVGTNLVANTLADLTKRECRFAHRWTVVPNGGGPPTENIAQGDPHYGANWDRLGLPTLCECSSDGWVPGEPLPDISGLTLNNPIDYWGNNPLPTSGLNQVTGAISNYPGQRIAEDVILTNVIGFDLQVWDPGAPVISDGSDLALGPADEGYSQVFDTVGWQPVSYGAYVDLGYAGSDFTAGYLSEFAHKGAPGSRLHTTLQRIYDTWSTHYEHDGIDQHGDGYVDLATDGFDSNDNGIVDDAGERETSPPYPVPLRGIRVKIRAFEPDSRQIREVTVVQDFLPK